MYLMEKPQLNTFTFKAFADDDLSTKAKVEFKKKPQLNTFTFEAFVDDDLSTKAKVELEKKPPLNTFTFEAFVDDDLSTKAKVELEKKPPLNTSTVDISIDSLPDTEVILKKTSINNITFDMSINSFRPLYFHFLDGFLNPECGSSMENIISLIKNYELIEINEYTQKIFFLQIKNNSFIFYNINNIEHTPITYKNVIDYITNINDKQINSFLQKLEYCIYHVGINKHATSILIQCKSNRCIISYFNSGMGIDRHSTINIGGDDYFKPYKSVILSDNIDKDKIDCIKKILILLLFPEYYKLLKKLSEYNNYNESRVKIDDSYRLNKSKFSDYNLFNELKIITNFLNKLDYKYDKNLIFEFKYDSFQYNLSNISNYNNKKFYLGVRDSLETLPSLDSYKQIDVILYNYGSISINIILESYYNMSLNYISQYYINDEEYVSNYNLYFDNENKNKYFNNILDNTNFECINSIIRHKIVFHYNDNDKQIYIREQESGSCAWFSIYWPLLYFYIKNNFDNYYNFIDKIYNTFLKILNQIFKQDEFINTKNLILKKVLYNKFLYLNFFNEKLSIKNIDSVYYTEYIFDYKEFNTINKIHIKEIIPIIIEKNFITTYLNNPYSMSCEYLYLLYYSDNFIFRRNVKQDNKIFSIIEKITKKNNNELYILLKNFEDSYDDDNTLYINMFISQALYLNYIYKKYNFKKLNILNNFCKFLYRFYLLVQILNYIFNIISEFKSTNPKDESYLKFIKDSQIIYDTILPILFEQEKSIFSFNDYYSNKITSYSNGIISNNIDLYFHMSENIKNINHYLNLNLFENNNTDMYGEITIFFKKYTRSINDYYKLLDFLFMNPKYIYQDFNYTEYTINESYFILFNIHYIFENNIYRENLIKFYASHFFNIYSKNKIITDELYWCLINLQLLCTKYISEFNKIYKNFHKTNFWINSSMNLPYEVSLINVSDFLIIIDKIFIIYNKNQLEFINYLIINKNNIVNTIDILLKKHFGTNYVLDVINNIIYLTNDDDNYKQINIDYEKQKLLTDYFDLSFIINEIDILLINNNKTVLYIINSKYYIKLIIKMKNEPISHTSLTITNIYYMNYIINKYSDINFPFKYTIPLTCFHMIYLNNTDNRYYITYIINNTNPHKLLGKCSLNNGLYSITINNNNLMYPDRETFKIFTDLCRNFDINPLNILYIEDYKKYDSKNTFLFLNKKYYESFKFNKQHFLIDNLKPINYNKINLISNNRYNKILFKISNCIVIETSKIIIKFNYIIESYEQVIHSFLKYIENKTLNNLFDEYINLYNFLLAIKIKDHLKILINLLEDSYKKTDYIEFCSQIKIFYDYYKVKNNSFNYKFEALFELICGYELYDEQMKTYYDIINKFIEYNKHNCHHIINKDTNNYIIKKKNLNDTELDILYNINQNGGTYISYPLRQLMMGKGKSAIITPILSLYFSLVHDKEIIIIIPSHLEPDTLKIMNEYIHIFSLDKLRIYSDDKIKQKFLERTFNDYNTNCKYLMLIDEFDYLLDPLKSNFNITYNKNDTIMPIFTKLNPPEYLDLAEHIEYLINIDINENIDYIMNNDIKQIIKQLNDKELVENINWGIHPTKFYAIPYRSKGNPLLDSNFSSCILTIYLTLYYYIVLYKYDISPFVYNCIIKFELYTEIFSKEEPLENSIEHIKHMNLSIDFKIKQLFKILFKNIFERIKITSYQYNTSFVDIINIEGLYKIGYSGTININFPPIKSPYNFKEITPDSDEEINVHYAITNEKSKLFIYNQSKTPFFYKTMELININDYDAIIDTIGLFKNNNNEDIALELFHLFIIKRDVIFIDETNIKYVISNNDITGYNKKVYDLNIFYKNPFIYYDQAHIVGVDIKQDKYPIMKGLCIINNLSIYSQIAQAIFRLRKINMGHSINLLYVTIINQDKILTKDKILELLLVNETTNKENKYINLLYQTLKSDIRKLRDEKKIKEIYDNDCITNKNITDSYDLRYFEKIKYYFTEKIETNYFKAYSDIFYSHELVNIHEIYYEYFEKIKNNINKLVYNIGSIQNSFELNYDQDQDIDKNVDLKTSILKLIDNQYNNNAYPLNDNLKFEYENYSFLLNFSDKNIFIKYTIKLDNTIRYLPNIFTQVIGHRYINNNSGYVFVYIHEHILIIPGYLIIYFYNKYPVLNYKLNIINDIIIDDEYNRSIIDCYKENNFFKILYSTEYIEYDFKIYNRSKYICFRMLCERKLLFEYQKTFIQYYSNIYKSYEHIIIRDYNDYKTRTKVLFIENFIIAELLKEYSQKYYLKTQKYKRKYLKLKKLMIL